MLKADVAIQERRALTAELSGLSEALWRCYTHPASAADSLEVNTEGWRREQTRSGFASVIDHIRRPNLPDRARWSGVKGVVFGAVSVSSGSGGRPGPRGGALRRATSPS